MSDVPHAPAFNLEYTQALERALGIGGDEDRLAILEADVPPAQGDNLPPVIDTSTASPTDLLVWDGNEWLLPAQHELNMLHAMRDDEDTPGEPDAQSFALAEAKLADQQAALDAVTAAPTEGEQ